ncbi:hypothetical protein KDL45_11435, partial [bacterium]|nr:hypothetical protein [bacterium]
MILQNKLATTALVGVLASTIFISSAQARTTYYWDGDGPGSIEGWEVIDAVLPEGHRYDTGWFYYYYLDAMVAKFRGTQGDGRAIDTTLISNGIDVSAMDNGTAYLTAGFYDYPGTIVQNGVFEFAAGPPDGPMTTLEPNIFEAVPEYFISEPFPIDTLMAENDELRFSWRFAADTEANDVNVLTYVTRLCVSSDCPVTSELRSHDNIKDGELTVDLYGMRYFSCVRAPDNSQYLKGARVRVVGSQAGISSGVTIYTFTGTPGPHDGEQFPFLSKGFGEWPTDDSVSEGKFGCNSRLSEPMNPDLLYC